METVYKIFLLSDGNCELIPSEGIYKSIEEAESRILDLLIEPMYIHLKNKFIALKVYQSI